MTSYSKILKFYYKLKEFSQKAIDHLESQIITSQDKKGKNYNFLSHHKACQTMFYGKLHQAARTYKVCKIFGFKEIRIVFVSLCDKPKQPKK
jgi:hypothetical protein